MNKYVLKNIDKDSRYCNKYVAIAGRKHSYTSTILYMQKFNSIEEAINGSCVDSEIPIPLIDLLGI